MLEYFPEPEYKADSRCANCGKPLYVGSTIADDDGNHICNDCMTAWALKTAKHGDLIEFVTSNNLEDQFTQWYYGDNIKTLTVREMEDIYE
jgi:hypothetical protein